MIGAYLRLYLKNRQENNCVLTVLEKNKKLGNAGALACSVDCSCRLLQLGTVLFDLNVSGVQKRTLS